MSWREMRVLDSAEIEQLLAAADDRHRPLLATALFTGLRLGELLGLTWGDVDFEAGLLRVRKQLARTGERVAPKTDKAVRDVVLMPALGRMLREHKLASGYSAATDFVFASLTGTPLQHRNVARRGLEPALTRAGLDGAEKPRFRFHECRHSYASLLIAEGLDVVFVSRQLGHANPSITLSVYSHLFDRAKHADRTRDALEASFGTILEPNGGDGRQPDAKAEGAEVLSLARIGG